MEARQWEDRYRHGEHLSYDQSHTEEKDTETYHTSEHHPIVRPKDLSE